MRERSIGAVWRIVVLVLLGILPQSAQAQDRYAGIAVRNSRPVVYHEAVVTPALESTGNESAQVAVLFRIPHSLLVFVQDGSGFMSEPDVTIGLYQEDEKVDEIVWRGEQRVTTFELTRSSEEDVTGRVLFRTPPGTYMYRVELGEETSGTRSGWVGHFEVPQFALGGIGTPFFIEEASAGADSFLIEPTNLGGDVPLGRSVSTAVPLVYSGSNATLRYSVYRLGGERAFDRRRAEPRRGVESEEIELRSADTRVRTGSLNPDSSANISKIDPNCFCWKLGGPIAGRLALLELDTETLESGVYVLELMLTTDEQTLQHRTRFETHWRNMPLSLYDVDVAIRNLSFIENRDRIRELLRGSHEEKVAAFRAYWQARDPSPATLSNELMEEYYRRVDHAASEFRTGKSPYPDGLRTDAARVYIVHGPPDDVSSSFPSSGGVQQVWTYPDGRQFVFWASSSLDPLVLEESTTVRGGGS